MLEMSDDELLKIRNFGDKSLAELKEEMIEHGMIDSDGGAAGAVPDISPDELGELMGVEEDASDSPVEAPGMSIESTGEVAGDDDSEDGENDDPGDSPEEEEA